MLNWPGQSIRLTATPLERLLFPIRASKKIKNNGSEERMCKNKRNNKAP